MLLWTNSSMIRQVNFSLLPLHFRVPNKRVISKSSTMLSQPNLMILLTVKMQFLLHVLAWAMHGCTYLYIQMSKTLCLHTVVRKHTRIIEFNSV